MSPTAAEAEAKRRWGPRGYAESWHNPERYEVGVRCEGTTKIIHGCSCFGFAEAYEHADRGEK